MCPFDIWNGRKWNKPQKEGSHIRCQEVEIPYKVGQRFRFIPFGDVHLGSKLSRLKHFQTSVIDRYKDDPDTRFFDMGDGCDMIIAQGGDRRFKASEIDEKYLTVDNPVDQQIDDYVNLLWPIKDRIISMVDCNHHLEILKRTGTHPTRRIGYLLWGKEAEQRVHSWSGFLITKFCYPTRSKDKASRVRSLTWYLSHGVTTGGRTLGGPKTSLANVAKGRIADIYIFAHNHGLWSDDNLKIGPDRSLRVISQKEIIVNAGCYKRSRTDNWDTSWEESKEFAPNALGHVEIYVEIDRNAVNTYTVKRMIL